MITIVERESPAAQGGLLPGDVIVRIGGTSIDQVSDMDAAVPASRGKLVEVEVYRKGDVLKKMVQFGGESLPGQMKP
jgi:C-terminal processing protease CtpA/Prc